MGLLNDFNTWSTTGFLTLLIGSKLYLTEAPLNRFPTKTALVVDAALATNSATTAQLSVLSPKIQGRPYYVDPPIAIMATQNFTLSLNYPAAVALPSGFNGRIGVIFDGYLFRNSQ
jgi:hypothetical protein